jgi:hypothetical protein
VAGAYLVAGCARRSADRRFGVLAAIGLKLGAYGFLRFSLPIAPDASHELRRLVIALSLIAVDLHRLRRAGPDRHEEAGRLLVDFAHGFRDARLLHVQPMGIEGALVQMISHGFVSGAMFCCIGVMYDRMHSRQIADYGGVVNTMPKFAALFMLFPWPTRVCRRPPVSSANSWSHPGCGSVQLLGWLCCGHHADRRRGLHAVDVQARHLRRSPITTYPRTDDINNSEFVILGDARCLCVDGYLPLAFHRGHARIGQ